MEKTITITITIIILLGFFGIVFYLQGKNNAEFSAWATKCLVDGGVTTITGKGFTYRNWECIKDGKIINHVN